MLRSSAVYSKALGDNIHEGEAKRSPNEQYKDRAKYGEKVIDNLSAALKKEFGKGFQEKHLEMQENFIKSIKIEFPKRCLLNLLNKNPKHCLGNLKSKIFSIIMVTLFSSDAYKIS